MTERRGTLRRVVSNAAWLIAERVLSILIAFVVTAWMVRYLGRDDFGRLSYAISVVGIVAAAAALGLDNIVVRHLVADPARRGTVLGTSFALRLAGALLGTAIVAGLALTREDPVDATLLLVLTGTLFAGALQLPGLWLRARLEGRQAALARSFAVVGGAGVRALMVALGASLVAFALASVLQTALVALALWWIVWRRGAMPPLARFDRATARDLLGDSWPLMVSALSASIYMKIDQVMIGELLTDADVGIYAAAVRISELVYFLPMLLAQTALPVLVEIRQHDSPERYRRGVQTFYDLMAAVGYVVVIPVVLGAPLAVSLAFGDAYAPSAEVLRVHMWSFLFVALGVARGQWLVAENYTRFSMVSTVLGAAVNVAMNLALIPSHGPLGAAWATLVSYSVATYWTTVLDRDLWQALRQLTLAMLLPLRLPRVWRDLAALVRAGLSRRA